MIAQTACPTAAVVCGTQEFFGVRALHEYLLLRRRKSPVQMFARDLGSLKAFRRRRVRYREPPYRLRTAAVGARQAVSLCPAIGRIRTGSFGESDGEKRTIVLENCRGQAAIKCCRRAQLAHRRRRPPLHYTLLPSRTGDPILRLCLDRPAAVGQFAPHFLPDGAAYLRRQ